jgi:hypothetical protein
MIRSLEDLLNSESYTLLLRKEGAAMEYFKDSPDNTVGNWSFFIV